MSKEAMKQLILEELSKKLGDGFHISIKRVLKTNIELDGLNIFKQGENISPTIYLDSYYEELENNIPLDEIVNDILLEYFIARQYPIQFDVSFFSDFSQIKNRLSVRLINKCLNSELLKDVPYMPFLDDFAVVAQCNINQNADGISNFLIHNSYLDIWNIDSKTLFSYAVQNSREQFGIELTPVDCAIKKLAPDMPMPGNFCPMWIMTNKQKYFGASTVLFDDVLKNFASVFGNFYVIFSSIHEAILLLTPDNSDIDVITSMNQSVNAQEVQANEVLGTKAYYYHKGTGFIL